VTGAWVPGAESAGHDARRIIAGDPEEARMADEFDCVVVGGGSIFPTMLPPGHAGAS
jgi:hypothetical protein